MSEKKHLKFNFFQEAAAELKKVTWPTSSETVRLSLIVIVASIISGIAIGGIDAGLVVILEKILP
jgi:preprotein translocase SecE subunit